MYIEVRPYVCGDSVCVNVNSCFWFLLCCLQAEVVQNHENENVHNIGKGGTPTKKM
jgi:hypothetical protein